MTTITSVGVEYMADYAFGFEADPIDTIAVGTGTAPESTGDTALENEIYRSSDPANVTFTDTEDDGIYIANIVLQGGTEVPAESSITELAIIVGGNNTMIARDVMSGIGVDAGRRVGITTEVVFRQGP